ncbi:MAG: HAD-IC family P-type ATPase [Dethiobacter sp.]|jgi:Ca2+-transporting ATPase|nr:HAD-IC family P-type ATPase [Dethiobacter sp.]
MPDKEQLFFQMKVDKAFEKLRSRKTGLTEQEAEERLQQYGANEIEDIQKIALWQIFLAQFKDPLIYILLAAAVVTTLLREFIDTYVILAVVFINALIGFIQEFKAEKATRALSELASPHSRVIRDNKSMEIDSRQLVPGDIVLLSSGNRVPADLRLWDTIKLEINESALTGESLGVLKNTEAVHDPNPPLSDRKNLVFMGTVVLSGRGKGIVFATGKHTEIGQISEKVKSIKPSLTPLQIQFIRLGKMIGLLVLIFAIISLLGGLLIGLPLSEILLTAIAMAVAAIPEGLPVVFTLTLAVGVNRMAKRNAIIRHLPAVETLGSCNIIASDKTGTLTKNEMTVQQIFTGGENYYVSGTGFAPEGNIYLEGCEGKEIRVDENEALRLCLLAGLLANESDLIFKEDKGYTAEGDPTETALIVSALKGGLDREEVKQRYTELDEIPFESERFYMATLHRSAETEENIVLVKGAPEIVLEMCGDYQADREGNPVSLNREEVLSRSRLMGEEGLRVLAMAYKKVNPEENKLESLVKERLVFAGLQGMMDPPREEAVHAIRQSQKAGLRIIMVTGDHQVTAVSIARKLGIVSGDNIPVLTGREIDNMSDDELYHKVEDVSVCARVSPLNKFRIVEQLIRRGDIVAVTGDGVNDAPALKAAHIGVAMGKAGTDVAKETSDMIIADDNFASIFAAVEEGRVVFSNLRKATFFLLSTGTGVIMVILLVLATGLPLPFLPAQILWLNLVTNGLQDVALAFEPKEEGILDHPPRNPREPIVPRAMAVRLLFVGLIMLAGTVFTFLWQLRGGASLEQARTVALTTMVMFQMFHVFNSRSELLSVFRIPVLSNKFLFYSVIAAFTAHLAVIYTSPLQMVFRTTPLALIHWVVMAGTASTVIIWEEIRKAYMRTKGRK